MLYCSDTTMDVNMKLHSNQWEQLEELEGHQCLVGILTTLPLLDQTSSLLIAWSFNSLMLLVIVIGMLYI